ncbi:MAG: 23S rRNA (pseudouridine(1915)-N(3))-methyltransferase RlmH [Candidatus Syntrophonatronum acetioxidans]|uniref:Ribosomal RNA large subunit methyltransferase H n=1 Tax=Candidatus Syntrophonatronum acetioxidans TaxID=1795816 RepID=A0A424YFT9_9FIRM|nr:MAG: 23S rRNA (pseudouridine(1915)-N(3))-methyltransferase RlmH [Candidatus Syntrophonatronum acetioxidans]
MRVKIIGVGKVKEKYLQEGMKEYLKRLQPYARVEIIEVPDEKIPEGASPGEEERVKKKEGEKVLKKLDPGAYTVVLALEGTPFSSEEWAWHLEKLTREGQSNINFIIGGTLGLSPEVKKKGDLLLSFSPLTFPHQLMRLILLEQIYRSFKIIRGEPYHR